MPFIIKSENRPNSLTKVKRNMVSVVAKLYCCIVYYGIAGNE